MRRIGDIIEERSNLITQERAILDKADTESRDLSAEERQEADGIHERIGTLTGDIRRHNELTEAESLDVRNLSVEQPETPETADPVGRDSVEYRDAFNSYARGLADVEQRSTLNTAADADGGYAVPEQWTELHESLRESGTIRGLATVFATASGGTLHVPYVSAAATAPAIVAEQDPIPDDGETFAEKLIGAFKYARLTKASEEMVQDSLFDLPAFVGSRLGFDLGRSANNAYVNGTGTGADTPQGLFVGATSSDTLASNTDIAPDEVIDLLYAVTRPYRANGVFLAADTTMAAIRKMKDDNGQYLWQPSMQAGQPDLLLGKPALSDPDIPVMAASKKVLGFGDVKRAYMIRDVLGVTIRVLLERFADNGQVAWRGQLRTSGAIVDQNAFKVVTTPA